MESTVYGRVVAAAPERTWDLVRCVGEMREPECVGEHIDLVRPDVGREQERQLDLREWQPVGEARPLFLVTRVQLDASGRGSREPCDVRLAEVEARERSVGTQ